MFKAAEPESPEYPPSLPVFLMVPHPPPLLPPPLLLWLPVEGVILELSEAFSRNFFGDVVVLLYEYPVDDPIEIS